MFYSAAANRAQRMKTAVLLLTILLCLVGALASHHVAAFAPRALVSSGNRMQQNQVSILRHVLRLHMATISEQEAQSAINKVVTALKKDKSAIAELGTLQKVNNILGFGSPKPGLIAVRFNASFQKGGMGRSAVPLPFGLGQSDKAEDRGTMVGQVKASVDVQTGKVVENSVLRVAGVGPLI
jgi:hypothetical protein